jgi:hypothetical protein
MGFISDYFRRRRLRPVLRRLPHMLAKRYGAAAFYNAAQVRATAGVLKLPPDLVTSAFAVACTADEFLKADPHFTEERYLAERKEVARISGIDKRDLNCRFLTKSFRWSVSDGDSRGGAVDTGTAGSPD